MNRLLRFAAAVVVALNVLACADDSGVSSIDQRVEGELPGTKPLPITPAAGFIRGQSWAFKSGRAVIFRSGRVPVLEVVAFSNEYEDPCDVRAGSGTVVRFLVQPQEDTFKLGSAPFDLYPNLFFIDSSKFRGDPRYSLAANEGRIQVVALRRDIAIVRIEAAYRGTEDVGRTEVFGQLAVPLCRSI